MITLIPISEEDFQIVLIEKYRKRRDLVNNGKMVFLLFTVILEIIADASITGHSSYNTVAGGEAFGVIVLSELLFDGVLFRKALG